MTRRLLFVGTLLCSTSVVVIAHFPAYLEILEIMAASSNKKLYYFKIEQEDFDRYQQSHIYQYFIPYHFISYRLLADLNSILDLSMRFKFVDKGYSPEQVEEIRKQSREVYVLEDPVKEADMESFICIFHACGDIDKIETLWYMGDIDFTSKAHGCGKCSTCNPPKCTHACPVCCKSEK